MGMGNDRAAIAVGLCCCCGRREYKLSSPNTGRPSAHSRLSPPRPLSSAFSTSSIPFPPKHRLPPSFITLSQFAKIPPYSLISRLVRRRLDGPWVDALAVAAGDATAAGGPTAADSLLPTYVWPWTAGRRIDSSPVLDSPAYRFRLTIGGEEN
jgi:hypothetical protein